MTEQESNPAPPKQIFVSGTAGRSSIATIIAAILHGRGDSVLLASSSWLHSPSEQIALDGRQLDHEQLAALGFAQFPSDSAGVARLIRQLTEQRPPDWLVVSGWPAQPLPVSVAVLTPVLPTANSSAAEAAEALLDRLPPTGELVGAPQRESVLDAVRPYARERGVRLSEVALSCRVAHERSDLDGQQFRLKTEAEDYRLRLPLLGTFQVENAATAILAVERALQAELAGHELQPAAVRSALEAVRLPGRAELIKQRPQVIVDSASNVASLRRLIEAIQPLVRQGRVQAVVDASAWNEIEEAVRALSPLEPEIIAAGPSTSSWAEASAQAGLPFRSAPSIEAAVETLTQGPGTDSIVVFGSRAAAAAARDQVLALLPADLRLN